VPLDGAHLLAAARYVELNPVRAGLAARPQDWPWSSARDHLAGRDDGLATVAPLLAMVGAWTAFLDGAGNEEEGAAFAAFRRHERTGRPLGDAAFIARLEAATGRPLARQKPGPKPRDGRAA